MSRHIWLVTAALITLIVSTCGHGEGASASQIHKTYEAYRAAITDQDGARAATLIGPVTIAYYEEIRRLALSAERPTLEARSMVDRLNTLSTRALVPAEQLEQLDGRGLFALAIRGGFVSGHAGQITLVEVRVDADRASGKLSFDGHTLPTRLGFSKVEGAWRVEPSTLFPALEDSLRALPRQLGQAPSAWLLETTSAVVGRPIDDSIWQPPRPSHPE